MTDTSRLDVALSRWLTEEAAVRAPQRLVHETRARVAATPQRRVIGGRFAWPRSITWRPLATLAVIGALVLAAASLSVYLARNGPAQSPSPAPTPSPVPTLTAVQPYECERSRGTCLGPLAAGVYETTTLQPQIRFAVPDGWSNLFDVANQYDLFYAAGGQHTNPDGITFSDRIAIYADPVAGSGTDGAPQVGVGTSAADLASWLAERPDLIASAPEGASIGSLPGFRVALSLRSGARSSPDQCTTEHGDPRCASLFVGADPGANYGFGLVGPESAVVYLLDIPTGGTLLLAIDDVDGVDAPGLISAATPIVESIGLVP